MSAREKKTCTFKEKVIKKYEYNELYSKKEKYFTKRLTVSEKLLFLATEKVKHEIIKIHIKVN